MGTEAKEKGHMTLQEMAAGSHGAVSVTVCGKRYDTLHQGRYLVLLSDDDVGTSLRRVAIDTQTLWMPRTIKRGHDDYRWIDDGVLRHGEAFEFEAEDGARLVLYDHGGRLSPEPVAPRVALVPTHCLVPPPPRKTRLPGHNRGDRKLTPPTRGQAAFREDLH